MVRKVLVLALIILSLSVTFANGSDIPRTKLVELANKELVDAEIIRAPYFRQLNKENKSLSTLNIPITGKIKPF